MSGLTSLHNRFAQEAATASAAILLVDPQEHRRVSMGDAAERVTNNLVGLVRVATAFCLPIIVTSRQQDGALIGALKGFFNSDNVIERPSADVFGYARIRDALQGLGRRILFMAQWGQREDIADAAIAGMDLRFDMRVVLDASWPAADVCGNRGIERMNTAGVEMTSWVAVLAALSQDHSQGDLSHHARLAISDSLSSYRPAVPGQWDGDKWEGVGRDSAGF